MTIVDLASVRYWEGRFPEAIAILDKVLRKLPNQLNPRLILNLSRIQSVQAELALADIRKMPLSACRR